MADPTAQVLEGVLKNMGLDKVPTEINRLNTTVLNIQAKQSEFQKSLLFTQQEHASMKREFQDLISTNEAQAVRLAFAENKSLHLEKELRDCKSRLIDLQSRSMKDNLVFSGIDERPGENTRATIISFLKDVMKMPDKCFTLDRLDEDDSSDDNTVWIQRSHRFGQTGYNGTPRPIVVKLLSGRECIMRYVKHLAGTNYYVNVQMPPEVAENRRTMMPIFKEAKRGKRTQGLTNVETQSLWRKKGIRPLPYPSVAHLLLT